MKPFIISALASAVAMGMLWFYFDYCADVFNNRAEIKLFIPSWNALSSQPTHYLHWSLLFILVPPYIFTKALRQSFGQRKDALKWFLFTTITMVVWLSFLHLVVDMDTVLLNDESSAINRGPYMSRPGAFLVLHFGLVLICIEFIRYMGKDTMPKVRSWKTVWQLHLPLIIYYITYLSLSKMGFLGSFEKTFLLPYSMQILWSAIIVAGWQLLLGWFLIKEANKADDNDTIAQTGT